MYYNLPWDNQKVLIGNDVFKYNALLGKWFKHEETFIRRLMRTLINKKHKAPAFTINEGSLVRTIDGIIWMCVNKNLKKYRHECDKETFKFTKQFDKTVIRKLLERDNGKLL